MADDVRLIDANKLLKKCIDGDGDDEFTEGYNFAVQEISAYITLAPTIEAEPVRRGKWEHGRCTECGKSLEDLFSGEFYYDQEEVKFCPNCGAKMGGGSDADS